MTRRLGVLLASGALAAAVVTFALVAQSGADTDPSHAGDPAAQGGWQEPDRALTKLPDGRVIEFDTSDHWDKIHEMDSNEPPPPGHWYTYRYNDKGEVARDTICHTSSTPATPEMVEIRVRAGMPRDVASQGLPECKSLESFNR